MPTDLHENATDRRAKAYRAAAALVPGGSFVIEYLINTIPDQRMERFTRFLELLDERVARLEASIDIDNPAFVELFEEAAEHAARSHGVHRGEYLSRIVVPETPTSPTDWILRRKLLQILKELSDGDIEILVKTSSLPGQAINTAKLTQPQQRVAKQDWERTADSELFKTESSNAHIELQVMTLERLGLLAPIVAKPNLQSVQDESQMIRALYDWLRDDGRPAVRGHKLTRVARLLIAIITGSYPRHKTLSEWVDEASSEGTDWT